MRKIVTILAVITAIPFLQVKAQEKMDTIQLKTIEIFGAKVIEGNKTVLQKTDIDNASLCDIGTALRNINGMSGIRKGGASIDPVIRGYRFSQLNVIADNGMHVEGGCPNRMDPVVSHLEPDDIESIEIVKGPYSLKYGPGFGGTIQMNTYKPKPFETFQAHARLRTTFNSNPMGFGQYAQITGGNKRVYFGVSGSYKDYNDYKDGNGNTVSSSFRKYNYSADLAIVPVKNHELLLSFHQNMARDLKFPALMMDEIEDNTTLLSMDYTINSTGQAINKTVVKLFHSDVFHNMDNSFRKAYSEVVPPNKGKMQSVALVDATYTGGRIDMDYGFKKHLFTSGIDVSNATKDGSRETTMIMVMNEMETITKKMANLWLDAHIMNAALFTEYKTTLNKWKMNAAARFDYNMAGSGDTLVIKKDDKTYFENASVSALNFSLNAGLEYDLSDNIAFSLYLGRGMRSPDMTERYIKFLTVGFDNYDYLGNPSLKPETNNQADFITDINAGKAGKLKLDIFASLVNNYITGLPVPASVATPKSMGALGVKQFNNAGNACFYGFDASYNSERFYGFSAIVAATYTYAILEKATKNIIEDGQVTGQVEVKNDAINEIPPLEARINLNYICLNEKLQLNAGLRLAAAQNHVSQAFYEATTPAYTLVDASLAYKPVKWMSFSAGVQNLLNEAYFDHLNRRVTGTTDKIYEPGRSFFANLVFNF